MFHVLIFISVRDVHFSVLGFDKLKSFVKEYPCYNLHSQFKGQIGGFKV